MKVIVRVSVKVRCGVRLWLQIELGLEFNVWVRSRFRFPAMVK